MLQMAKKLYFLLKGAGLATSDLVADYEALQQLVGSDREVAWADLSSCGDGSRLDETNINTTTTSATTTATEDFDINRLLDFPVLNCVNVTRKYL